MARVLWPDICIATRSGMPARTIFLTAVRLKSWAEESRIEHLYGGAPDDAEINARRAYVFAYNGAFKVPQWAAWSATKEFRDTPKRIKRWKTF